MSEFPPSDNLGPAPTSPFGDPPGRGGIMVPRWLALGLAVVLVFGGGLAVGRWAIGGRSSTTSRGRSTPPTTAALAPPSTDTSVLSRVIVQQSDVGANLNVVLLPNGDQVSQPTLDLCNGAYATESHRTTRLQDVVEDTTGTSVLSTEAVLYQSAGDSARAFQELKHVAATCPHTPVSSPVGEPSVTTKFDPPPDARWPAPPAGVQRLAYSFTTTDAQGRSTPGSAIYLRRGKALMGVYFSQPTMTPPPIGGQTSVADIVGVFASRLAQLPASSVS
ncbi:MAG TPA: hypothetical protein VGU73_05495 [Acidimicrobiia bacterium]|nr:hypothetical protein [Acidimicrobiia bacterium]